MEENNIIDPENNCSSGKELDAQNNNANNCSSGKELDAQNNNALDSAKEPKRKKKKRNPLKEKAKPKGKQPIMSVTDFMVKYPHVDAAINDISSFEKLTRDGKNLMRNYMVFVSEEELDDMESAWNEYHLQEIEYLKRRMLLLDKQSSLVQEAAKARSSRIR
ncbi:hypothetical protein L2E82_51739 [Cichorium intybus]|nr:hypothetical protein L2E82_51739 [Cichorium intybus]